MRSRNLLMSMDWIWSDTEKDTEVSIASCPTGRFCYFKEFRKYSPARRIRYSSAEVMAKSLR